MCTFFSLSANIEEEGFTSCASPSHQGAIKMFGLHFWEASLSSCFVLKSCITTDTEGGMNSKFFKKQLFSYPFLLYSFKGRSLLYFFIFTWSVWIVFEDSGCWTGNRSDQWDSDDIISGSWGCRESSGLGHTSWHHCSLDFGSPQRQHKGLPQWYQ